MEVFPVIITGQLIEIVQSYKYLRLYLGRLSQDCSSWGSSDPLIDAPSCFYQGILLTVLCYAGSIRWSERLSSDASVFSWKTQTVFCSSRFLMDTFRCGLDPEHLSAVYQVSNDFLWCHLFVVYGECMSILFVVCTSWFGGKWVSPQGINKAV